MENRSQKRLQILASHIGADNTDALSPLLSLSSLDTNASCTSPSCSPLSVDVQALRSFLDSKFEPRVRDETRKLLASSPELKDCPEVEYREMRKVVHHWVEVTLKKRPVSLYSLRDDPHKYFAFLETLNFFNPNLLTKLAVQWGLFGGSLLLLGTERHAHLIPKAESGEIMGCFGMTELGHGSNVRGLETTATYDKRAQEFIIHSPTPTASKFWIGNAAIYAEMCVVFAQLHIDGENKGVHAFLVRIRDANKNVCKGVTIRDCGHKQGLNGVDNGAITFDHMRVPRESLLNKFSDVTASGEYTSKFSTPIRNFAATVGALTSGRVVIGSGSVSISKVGLAIALRYGRHRKQFGASEDKECFVGFYPSFYKRLVPLLARTVAFDVFGKRVADAYALAKKSPEALADAHYLSACLKSFASWHLTHTLNTARMCCGGQGFRSYSKIATLLADSHVFNTFEGDNIVLLQQITKHLLSVFTKQSKAKTFSGVFSYLNACGAVADTQTYPSACPQALLQNPRYLQTLFREREVALIKSLLGTMASLRAEKKMNEFDIFNSCQNLANQVAEAHVDRLLHEDMMAAVSQAPHSTRQVLEKVMLLSSLTAVHKDLGWFVSNEVVALKTGRAIEPVIEQLCKQVNTVAMDIVNSFGIPETCLPADPLLLEF